MDIGSGAGYPAAALSNFAPHPFTIDNIECNSMEGFLQSLKFKDPEMQKFVCTLVGKKAKFKGKRKNWYRTQTLYWQGQEIARDSDEYTNLITRAYDAIFENDGFKNALAATKGCTLTHSMGKSKKSDTVLTQSEFIGQLNRLRRKL